MTDTLIPDGMIATPFFEDKSRWIAENELAFVITNLFPVAEGHCLILPKRVVVSPTDLTDDEMLAIFALMKAEKARMQQDGIDDITWGWNDGIHAGQSVAHVHLHLIPRRQGDVKKARGGICNIFENTPSYYDAPSTDPTQAAKCADFITEVSVTDPDDNQPVDVAIYKDRESGGMFGVDSSYLVTLSDDDPVNNPFNGNEILLVEQGMCHYVISNITYDEGHDQLPKTLNLFLPDDLDEDEAEEEASEFISNETGFCHKGFKLEKS